MDDAKGVAENLELTEVAKSTKEQLGQGDLTMPKLVNITWVQSQTGMSAPAIYASVERGTFPRSIKLAGSRSVRWLASEIHTWVAQQIANRDAVTAEEAAFEAEQAGI
jgi:predicted DNA-binding transcriptional regulator AlpA